MEASAGQRLRGRGEGPVGRAAGPVGGGPWGSVPAPLWAGRLSRRRPGPVGRSGGPGRGGRRLRAVREERGAAAVRERPRVRRRRAGLPAAVRRQLDLWKELPEHTWEMLRSTVGF